MSDLSDFTDASPSQTKQAGSRVRFQGIVEDAEGQEPVEYNSFETWAASDDRAREREVIRLGRQLNAASRGTAVFVFCTVFLGIPLGTMLSHWFVVKSLEGWSLTSVFSPWSVALGIIVPLCLLVIGYVGSRMSTMIGAAEAIAAAAQEYARPDEAAIRNVQTVGAVVRSEMEALNTGIDDALIRLASVEAMIRQHVVAIEQAGETIETRTSSATERVASERSRLIELTEMLNARADDFATAIAERAQSSIEALQTANASTVDAEANLDERLAGLESAARRALESFDALRTALVDADDHVRQSASSIETSAGDAQKASERVSKIADAAAESAARNAANIGQFSARAAAEAKKTAEEAIETARAEAERAGDAAVEFTTREAQRVTEAAAKALEGVRSATHSAVESAAGDAEKAAAAADLVTEAARKATTAARDASTEVKKASETAAMSADEAVAVAKTASERAAARNRELAQARAALEAENTRLESLIEEQRKRADRLAEAIATQTERLSKLAENQLREQEAAARLAEAQNEMQQRASEKENAGRAAPGATPHSRTAAPQHRATPKPQTAPHRPPVAKKPLDAATDDAVVLNLNKPRKTSPPQEPPRRTPTQRSADAERLDQLAAEMRRDRPNRDDTRRKEGVSWREILTATDDAAPLDLGVAAKSEEPPANAVSAMKMIGRLQLFTLDLETRLYGDPPPALLERFERGDRNVFANRLLRLNEADVKRRIRAESARDRHFEKGIHDFLQGFERLLEDATTSETADEELEEYLSSPLGRVYLMIGATVGYFA
ncbi:MAG: hypothetical protein KDA46_08475 [Parvularculaceae bacterium]|nr:hypothetical protein [Parvularculaceae bacterium]